MIDPQHVFVDTGAFYAIKDQDDAHHQEAVDFLINFTGQLVTTNFVIDETVTLVLHKLGYNEALKLGEDLWAEKYAHVIQVTKADQRAAWELFKAYDDKTFSFTDCTSFAVMDRLGLEYAFAFDADFEQTGKFTQLPKM
jgi:uncharacterized protein